MYIKIIRKIEDASLTSDTYKVIYEGDVFADELSDVPKEMETSKAAIFGDVKMQDGDFVEVIGNHTKRDFYYYKHDFFGKLVNNSGNTQLIAALSSPLQFNGRKMVVVEPGLPAYAAMVDDSLKGLQRAVGGYIEITYPFGGNAMVIGNEEAKLIRLPGNRRINGSVYAGNLLIAADDFEGGFKNMTDKEVKYYTTRFCIPDKISDDEVQNDIGIEVYALW